MSTSKMAAAFRQLYARHFTEAEMSKNLLCEAFTEAELFFNSKVWRDKREMRRAFFLLAAHCLTLSLQLQSEPYFPPVSQRAGELQAAYGVPDDIAASRLLSYLSLTFFGCRYAALLKTRLQAAFFICPG
jgi:hypothetical protein